MKTGTFPNERKYPEMFNYIHVTHDELLHADPGNEGIQ